jgi:hypothetical protein
MTVYAKVVLDNILQSNSQNLLAAFDKAGVAGAVVPLPEDNGVFQLTIWQNANKKQMLDLKFYDALTGKVYLLNDQVEFATETQAGTLDSPLELTSLYEEVELTLDVQQGWNWISFGVLPADAGITGTFGDYIFTDNDLIKGADGVATYFEGKWYPEGFTLESGKMYALLRQATGSASVSVIGGEQEATADITLVKGWNWLGYTPSAEKSVSEALSRLNASNGDLIKGQSIGSVTYNKGAWVPGDKTMLPGQGYMLRVAKEQVFRFEAQALALSAAGGQKLPALPSINNKASAISLNANSLKLGSTSVPDWIAPEGKANNMVVYASVKIDNKEVVKDGSQLAAFIDGQIAGVAQVGEGPSGSVFQLQVFTDGADGAEVSFQVYDAGSDKTWNLKETVSFEADGRIEVIDAPLPLTYTTPEPEVTTLTISGTVGVSLTANITATNSPTSYELVSGSWPAGLSLNSSTGVLSGIPTTAGNSSVTVVATNGGGNGTGTLTFNISKGSQTISGVAPTQSREAGSAAYSLNATVSSNLTLSYASSNTKVATVAADGVVTVLGAGTATLTVSQAGDANYNAATSVTQTLTVTSAPPPPSGGGGGAGSGGGGAPAQVQKSKKGKGKSSSASTSGESKKSSAKKSSGGSSKKDKGSKSSDKQKSGGKKKSKK